MAAPKAVSFRKIAAVYSTGPAVRSSGQRCASFASRHCSSRSIRRALAGKRAFAQCFNCALLCARSFSTGARRQASAKPPGAASGIGYALAPSQSVWFIRATRLSKLSCPPVPCVCQAPLATPRMEAPGRLLRANRSGAVSGMRSFIEKERTARFFYGRSASAAQSSPVFCRSAALSLLILANCP